MELMSIKQTKMKHMDILESKCFRIFLLVDIFLFFLKRENSKFSTFIHWGKNLGMKVLLLSRDLVAREGIRWQIFFGCRPEFFKDSSDAV